MADEFTPCEVCGMVGDTHLPMCWAKGNQADALAELKQTPPNLKVKGNMVMQCPYCSAKPHCKHNAACPAYSSDAESFIPYKLLQGEIGGIEGVTFRHNNVPIMPGPAPAPVIEYILMVVFATKGEPVSTQVIPGFLTLASALAAGGVIERGFHPSVGYVVLERPL